MRRPFESLCVLAVAATAFLAADMAHAESRLFSAKTTQAGVTIVEAAVNGKQLPVAGQNGAATFFRVENPSGPVPCFNRIKFTASNGRTVDSQVNICINNGALVLALNGSGGGTVVGGGNAGAGAAGGAKIVPLPPAAPAVAVPVPVPVITPPAGGQSVTIVTDDPSVTIAQVFLRGQLVPVAARQDPYVQIKVLGGPQGFECSRDLGLAFSDGRRIARLVDVCQTNFLVVVALVGGPRPPAPPSGMQVQPPLVQPLPEPQPETGPSEVISNMQWLFSATGDRASFAYAIPETDASELTAVCAAQSAKVTITLTRSADEVAPGGKVAVRFTAGAFTKNYTATGSVVSELDGLSHPVLQIGTADPLWPALIKESFVTIAIGSAPPFALSLTGSAVKAKQFLAACNPQLEPEPPLPPVAIGGDGAVNYACDDGSFVTVTYDADAAVVAEIGAPPIFLRRAAFDGDGARYVAGLSELVGGGEQIFWIREGGFSRACMPN